MCIYQHISFCDPSKLALPTKYFSPPLVLSTGGVGALSANSVCVCGGGGGGGSNLIY